MFMGFTEVTSESWMGRMGKSIMGVLVGILLFIAGFPVLFWNEGRAVATAKALDEGGKSVVSIDPARVDPAKDKKLVHLTGMATTEETLKDPVFGVSVKGIRLVRTAEMFQWKESEKSRTDKKLGGGQQTVTTYTYSTEWSPRVLDSSKFKEAQTHTNPQAMAIGKTPIDAAIESARQVTVGAFTLPDSLVQDIPAGEPVAVTDETLAALPEELKGNLKVVNGTLYKGADPAAPQVGDIRISFKAALPATVSLYAQQVGTTFAPYTTSNGRSLSSLRVGTFTPEAMFAADQAANSRLTWILRAVGFGLMFIGLMLVAAPAAVLADVIPFLGDLLRMGFALFAGIIALACSVVTIAIGWLAYRPVMGIGLIAVAVASVIAVKMMAKKKPALAAA